MLLSLFTELDVDIDIHLGILSKALQVYPHQGSVMINETNSIIILLNDRTILRYILDVGLDYCRSYLILWPVNAVSYCALQNDAICNKQRLRKRTQLHLAYIYEMRSGADNEVKELAGFSVGILTNRAVSYGLYKVILLMFPTQCLSNHHLRASIPL